VKTGAGGVTDPAGIVPTWTVCGTQIATGIVPINVELAKPESATLTRNSGRMTRSADGANAARGVLRTSTRSMLNLPLLLYLRASVRASTQ